MVLGVQQIVVAEAMLLGQALGLEASVLASVINNSTGACWASSVNNPVPSALLNKSPPCERDYDAGFSTSLMLKVNCNDFFSRTKCWWVYQDMGLASNISRQRKSPLPLGEAAEEIYAKAIEKYSELASKDFSSVYRFLKDQWRTNNSSRLPKPCIGPVCNLFVSNWLSLNQLQIRSEHGRCFPKTICADLW